MKQKFVCTICGYVGYPKKEVKGSGVIELFVWLLFFWGPALIYSIWRRVKKPNTCPACGDTKMIPVNTPAGQKMAKESQGAGEIATTLPEPDLISSWSRKLIMLSAIIGLLGFAQIVGSSFNKNYILPITIGLVVIWYLWTKRDWLKKKMRRGIIEQQTNV